MGSRVRIKAVSGLGSGIEDANEDSAEAEEDLRDAGKAAAQRFPEEFAPGVEQAATSEKFEG